jgi:hypothetical protein
MTELEVSGIYAGGLVLHGRLMNIYLCVVVRCFVDLLADGALGSS